MWPVTIQLKSGAIPACAITTAIFVILLSVILVVPGGAANVTSTATTTQTATTTATATTATTTTTTTVTATSHATTHATTAATTTATTAATTSTIKMTVGFSGEPTEGVVPLTVQFTDMTTGGPTSWSWDFGDGTYGTEQNPSHTYTLANTYQVRLTVGKGGTTNSMTRNEYITVEPEPTTTATATSTTSAASSTTLAAFFDASPRTGSAPLSVVFSDSSTGTPSAWNWDFGDYSSSTEQNPVHTYTSPGTYTVTLTVNKTGDGKILKKSGFIIVNSTPGTPTTERTLPGARSSDALSMATATPKVTTEKAVTAVIGNKSKTPTPTLTGKAWLEYEKQRMAEIDALAASRPQNKDIFTQIIEFFRGLIPFGK